MLILEQKLVKSGYYQTTPEINTYVRKTTHRAIGTKVHFIGGGIQHMELVILVIHVVLTALVILHFAGII